MSIATRSIGYASPTNCIGAFLVFVGVNKSIKKLLFCKSLFVLHPMILCGMLDLSIFLRFVQVLAMIQ